MEKPTDRTGPMEMDRRMFLQSCGAALGLLALKGVASAVAAEPEWTAVGAATEFPLDEPKYLKDYRVYVMRGPDEVRALSSRCTHRGCTVDWLDSEFVCPCHQARFSMAGEVLEGPARDPLEAVPAKIEADQVWLGL